MRYTITVWKYDGDALDYRCECHAATSHEAREVFDTITRGIRGYYQAWLIDTSEGREIRYSSVLVDGPGAR